MKSERAIKAQLEQIELDIKGAERFYKKTRDMAEQQITEARNEYERQKSAVKSQVAEARRKLNIARIRRRNFLNRNYERKRNEQHPTTGIT